MVKKKKKTKKVTDKQKRLKAIRLGWEILGHKFRYYEGANHGIKPVSDAEYDKVEDQYKS